MNRSVAKPYPIILRDMRGRATQPINKLFAHWRERVKLPVLINVRHKAGGFLGRPDWTYRLNPVRVRWLIRLIVLFDGMQSCRDGNLNRSDLHNTYLEVRSRDPLCRHELRKAQFIAFWTPTNRFLPARLALRLPSLALSLFKRTMGDTTTTGSGDVRIFRVVEGGGDCQATAEFRVLIRSGGIYVGW